MDMPPCNCHCSLEEVDDETSNRWTNVARAASLAVRREKAARKKEKSGGSAISMVSELGRGSRDGEVSRGDAEAQRKQAAREAVRLELAEKRSTLNAQLSTLK